MRNEQAIRKACERAICNISYEGLTDVAILERPFEIEALHVRDFANQLRAEIVNRVLERRTL